MKMLRITVICLTVWVVLGIGVRMALPTILVVTAKHQLAKCLTAPVKLETIHLGLLGGRATVQGLTVAQPVGFRPAGGQG